MLGGTGTSSRPDRDAAIDPEVEERVEVVVERVNRCDVENLVNEDVRLELPHEEQGQRTRTAAADDADGDGAGEVVGDDAQRAARRARVGRRVERDDERRLPRREMHLHGDGGADDAADERDGLLREVAQHHARIARGVGASELFENRRHADLPRHRAHEERLLRREVPQDRGGCHAEDGRDVGQRGPFEPARDKDGPGGGEDLVAVDARWTSHS